MLLYTSAKVWKEVMSGPVNVLGTFSEVRTLRAKPQKPQRVAQQSLVRVDSHHLM